MEQNINVVQAQQDFEILLEKRNIQTICGTEDHRVGTSTGKITLRMAFVTMEDIHHIDQFLTDLIGEDIGGEMVMERAKVGDIADFGVVQAGSQLTCRARNGREFEIAFDRKISQEKWAWNTFRFFVTQ